MYILIKYLPPEEIFVLRKLNAHALRNSPQSFLHRMSAHPSLSLKSCLHLGCCLPLRLWVTSMGDICVGGSIHLVLIKYQRYHFRSHCSMAQIVALWNQYLTHCWPNIQPIQFHVSANFILSQPAAKISLSSFHICADGGGISSTQDPIFFLTAIIPF